MLDLQQLEAHAGNFLLQLEHWDCQRGRLHALLGCNGAGKSTLLRCLTGELRYRGSIRLHGRPLQDWDVTQRARHLGVLPQASVLDFPFTASEVVALGATPLRLGWRETPVAVRKVMEQTDTAQLADAAYPRLSGGEKQRVHLARVLLQLSQAELPPCLLLDEPTSAQDLQQQHRMLSLLRTLCETRDYAAVAILHDLNHALRYAHECSVLAQGRLASRGAPACLLTPDCVARHWGYAAQRLQDPAGQHVLV